MDFAAVAGAADSELDTDLLQVSSRKPNPVIIASVLVGLGVVVALVSRDDNSQNNQAPAGRVDHKHSDGKTIAEVRPNGETGGGINTRRGRSLGSQ